MRCDVCEYWTTAEVTNYADGSEVINWSAPEGKGRCSQLDIDTPAEFGCLKFVENSTWHIKRNTKDGSPWQHWVYKGCPDCTDLPGCNGESACHRCAGTGKVRYYDDGYVGDEQTKTHPQEKKNMEPPKCSNCGEIVNINWKGCPMCGARLEPVATLEIVDGLGNAGGIFSRQQV